jgi:hypothetical protein
VVYVKAESRGRLVKADYSYLEKHAKELGILKIFNYFQPGEICEDVGYVLIKGVKPDEVLGRIELVRKHVKIQTE